MSGKAFLDTIGLGSRIAEPEGGDNVILRLSPAMIEPDPAQPRKVFDEEQLRELAASLVRHGQLQPIRVRKAPCVGRYIVVAGERRWRAARLANLQKIDAVVVAERGDTDVIREEQVVENLQRAELSPLESAHAYRSLMERWSCSQAEVARRLGVSTSTVSRALALLQSPDETRAAIAAGTSVRQATATARPSKKRPAKADKRRAVELELPSGFVRVKRGATVEKLLEELRATIAEQSRADAA
jgi:ParB/RepB/Spo0J family partition protein